MRLCVLSLAVWVVSLPSAGAEELLRLRLGQDFPKTAGKWAGGVRVEVTGTVAPDEERPGGFIYDTLRQKSEPAAGSLKVDAGGYLRLTLPGEPFPAGRSFTVELFVQPDRPWRGPLVRLARRDDKRGECGLQPVFYPQFGNQHYYGGYALLPGGGQVRETTGEYGSVSYLNAENTAWRHVAMAYDAPKRTITWYTDYFMSTARQLGQEPAWDGTTVYVAGAPDRADFAGRVAELRVTDAALQPADFLRAGAAELARPFFRSADEPLPVEAKLVNVKSHFGAVGDGKHDDTAAIQKAFMAVQARHAPSGAHVLYFPAGEYLVSDKVQWSRFLTVRGAGPGKTVLRLRDNCPGFGDPNSPRPVLVASSTPGPAGSEKSVNGSSIANWLIGFTVDTGRGNPGAKALEFHSNNMGGVEDVHLRSGDGAGYAGLDLTRRDCGPALYKNVTVEGFDVGVSIRIRSQEYSHTFQNLTLRRQNRVGLENWANVLAVRGLRSDNAVTAVACTGGNSMLTLLDADLRGGGADVPAVLANGGLYVRNLATAGYKTSVRQTVEKREGKKVVATEVKDYDEPRIDELVGGKIVCLRGAAKGSLKLPVQDPPAIPWGDRAGDWVAVAAFKTEANDWADAFEAAMATGKPNVCFGRGHYTLGRPVTIAASVRRVHLASAGVGLPKGQDGPVFIVGEGEQPLAIEHGEVRKIEHRGSRTVLLRHGGMNYAAKPGAGDVFIEDVVGGQYHFVKGQRVWAWQWNVEAHGSGPCVVNDGATLWVLGFKTEYESEKLDARAGSRTEILGAFIYPIGQIPPTRPIFRVTGGDLAVVYGTSVYAANHKVHVIDTQGGRTVEVDNGHLTWVGSRARMDLYVTRPR